MLGAAAYTGQGIYKSIHTATHKETRRHITWAKRSEGVYLLENKRPESKTVELVLKLFEGAKDKKSKNISAD